MGQLTETERTEINTLVSEFNTLKMQLGDTYMNQQALLKKIEEVKESYSKVEVSLMETYGKDAVINVETGEVSLPEEKEEVEMKVEK
jgi:hypothetical protein|tara:strand:- start:1473 stop:1733 length:261 start_codon:yes stop_codon:yes gene_type:complete